MGDIHFRSLATLAAAGFSGGFRVKDCPAALSQVPQEPGVYMVGREDDERPMFIADSRAGRFKSKNPTVDRDRLARKWVSTAKVLYIGESSNLHERLHTLFRFGQGDDVGHWGGRFLWQLRDAAELRLYWQAIATHQERKSELLHAFKKQLGSLPFANLRFSTPDMR